MIRKIIISVERTDTEKGPAITIDAIGYDAPFTVAELSAVSQLFSRRIGEIIVSASPALQENK